MPEYTDLKCEKDRKSKIYGQRLNRIMVTTVLRSTEIERDGYLYRKEEIQPSVHSWGLELVRSVFESWLSHLLAINTWLRAHYLTHMYRELNHLINRMYNLSFHGLGFWAGASAQHLTRWLSKCPIMVSLGLTGFGRIPFLVVVDWGPEFLGNLEPGC